MLIGAANRQVDVRVLGVEVLDGDPLQAGAEISLHLSDETLGVGLHVHALAEFRADDELEEVLVAGSLPGS